MRALDALTLRWVNRQRRRAGDPALRSLVTGRANTAGGCGIAMSVGHGARIWDRTWQRHEGDRHRWLPFAVRVVRLRIDQRKDTRYDAMVLRLRDRELLRSASAARPVAIERSEVAREAHTH